MIIQGVIRALRVTGDYPALPASKSKAQDL